jgi:hypothetical protein
MGLFHSTKEPVQSCNQRIDWPKTALLDSLTIIIIIIII